MKKKISPLSSVLLVLASVFLVVSLYVPLWQIDLQAPQYPEGLTLKIWANKIAGDVEIINGLNHYIGMKTLHTDDFFEFTILPYLIGAFALLFLLVAIIRSKKGLYFALGAFALFGVVAMADFWLWEYEYGHNLDPNAAIKVPGMAYQPPLIGFKQLLNFGAFSIPDIGGWLFIGAGVLLVIAVAFENGWFAKWFGGKKISAAALGLVALLVVSACGSDKPQEIKLNIDDCDFCRMTISDGKFGAEIMTNKGRVYMFDDLSCMLGYIHENGSDQIKNVYINDYNENNKLIDAASAWYVTHNSVKSPMGGNTAAFATREAAEDFAAKNESVVTDWSGVSDSVQHHHDDHEHHH